MIWRRAQALLLLIAGFAIWSSAFVTLYALLSLGCRFEWETATWGGVSVLRWILFVAWAAHIVAIGALLIWLVARREESEDSLFLPAIVIGVTVASLVATVWTGAPHLFLDLCH